MFTIKTVVFSLLFHTSPIFRVTLLCTHKVRKTRRGNLALAFLYNFYSLYIISYESLMICVAPGFYRVKVQFPTSGKWMNVNNWCVSLVWGQEWDGARSWLSLKVYDPAGDKGELAVKASFERWWKSILIVKWAAETQLYEVKTFFFLIMQTPNTKTRVIDDTFWLVFLTCTSVTTNVSNNMYKPREIHKITHDNGAFHLIACCYNFQDRAREEVR